MEHTINVILLSCFFYCGLSTPHSVELLYWSLDVMLDRKNLKVCKDKRSQKQIDEQKNK